MSGPAAAAARMRAAGEPQLCTLIYFDAAGACAADLAGVPSRVLERDGG